MLHSSVSLFEGRATKALLVPRVQNSARIFFSSGTYHCLWNIKSGYWYLNHINTNTIQWFLEKNTHKRYWCSSYHSIPLSVNQRKKTLRKKHWPWCLAWNITHHSNIHDVYRNCIAPSIVVRDRDIQVYYPIAEHCFDPFLLRAIISVLPGSRAR